MSIGQTTSLPALIVRAQNLTCAIPLKYVAETMRPLPVESLREMPSFVIGLAVIRGGPVPVISVAALFGGNSSRLAARFVSCRAGERWIALAVSDVIGVYNVEGMSFETLPSLLQQANSEFVAAIGTLDQQLLLLLEVGRILPAEDWDKLLKREN